MLNYAYKSDLKAYQILDGTEHFVLNLENKELFILLSKELKNYGCQINDQGLGSINSLV